MAFERFRDDRLLRWGAYASVPFAWLALALFDPFLLLVPPMLVFALWKAMGYGMVERFEAPPDPDLL
jgi:hypothetical protein